MLRKTLFWLHLVAGLIAGSVILIMSFTGAVLAFENEIVAWAERDVRKVSPPSADAARLPVDDLLKNLRAAQPEARPQSIAVSADPTDAVAISLGRDNTVYANPYTGDIRVPASTQTHDFMHLMTDWHRWLATSGDNRPLGKAVTGASNLAFVFLAVSGLYLWFPRKWIARAFRPALWFAGAKGKARDWNWHNVYGFWALIPIFVMAVSGSVISYRWASNLVYRVVGETPPVQAGPGAPAPAAAAPEIVRPSPDARPAGYAALLASVQTAAPAWELITLRIGGAQGRGGAAAGPRPAGAPENVPASPTNASAGGATTPPPAGAAGGESRPARTAPQPITATVRLPDRWPRTATTTLTLNPYTAQVLKTEGFGDLSTGRQARTWLRFLHTGQALGWPGQLIGALGCLAGCVLVYTGFALSWRRFFGKKVAIKSAA